MPEVHSLPCASPPPSISGCLEFLWFCSPHLACRQFTERHRGVGWGGVGLGLDGWGSFFSLCVCMSLI